MANRDTAHKLKLKVITIYLPHSWIIKCEPYLIIIRLVIIE